MAMLPSGTVTFLFTDIEGSTARWEQQPELMSSALSRHDALLRAAIGANGGLVFATGGDGVAAVFARAEQAVAAATQAQGALTSGSWPGDLPLKVRMGLHTGECDERDGDYLGPAVNRAARVMRAANGGQVFVSGATRDSAASSIGAGTSIVDLGDHVLADIVEPVRLYRVDATAFASDPRPPRTGRARAGNLPEPTGLVVGRDRDVREVVADVAAGRVVTLAGVGGVGKTRLALEVARAVRDDFRDGAWLIELDRISREEAVVSTMLSVLSIDGEDLDALLRGLRFRDTLLVLDNCEHVLDRAADVVATVVATCPAVRVLVTSREPLDIEGERTRRVRSLDTDPDGSAIELFRLRVDEAGGELEEGDAAAVTRICQRLDGIPLAIELAASRVRSLRPAEIADRLDDMFQFLAGPRRARVERHRTLQATLDWSYDLLDAPERALLARLAVFGGSFSLPAAEAIVTGDPIRREDVAGLVDHLVTRSLLVSAPHGAESRYRMLEPVRQLAAQKLAGSENASAVRGRHARFYLDLIVELDVRWRGGDDQGAWPVALLELSNLRLAFDHLVDEASVDEAEHFATAAFEPIGMHFDGIPSAEWAPVAAALQPDRIGPWTASACALAAWGAMAADEPQLAAQWLSRGAAALEAGSLDEGFIACAAVHLAVFGGPRAISDDLLSRSLDSALASDDPSRAVWVLAYAGRGNEAVEVARRLGNRVLLTLALSIVALMDLESNEAAEAWWEAAQASHSYLMRNLSAHRLGFLHIQGGAPVDGLLLLREPLTDWMLRGDVRVWDVLHSIALGLARLGDFHVAAQLLGAVGDRHIDRALRTSDLDAILERELDSRQRERQLAAGRQLDLDALVALGLERIDAAAFAGETSVPSIAPSTLTPRQREVAALIARGMSNKQIAAKLDISRYTAETHVRNILERLDATSRSQVAAWVLAVEHVDHAAPCTG